jgi:hypothetical protein
MKIFIKNKKSFALILAVFVLLAFSVTGITAISLLSRRAANTFQVDSMRAFYAADAARNYYLERISFANNFTATECDIGNFMKTLGSASFSISYTTRAARSATIVFTGTTNPSDANSSYEITQLVQENSQTIAGIGSVPTLTIVDHIRKFNLIVWGSTDPTYIRLVRDCMSCDNCNSGTCSSSQGQNFFANTYFNQNLFVMGEYYVNCCTRKYNYDDPSNVNNYNLSTRSRTVWGSSTAPRSVYVNGILDLTYIYKQGASPYNTTYGVWNTAYYRTWGGVPLAAFHANPPSVNCVTNPTNSECQNWPTTAPTINRAYYDALITRAASSAIGNTLIDTVSPYRQLNNRNIFFHGNVTISTTDALPLQGPGNIIATGNITISNNAFIRERVGLIAAGNITIGTNTRIGGAGAGAAGYDTTNQLIIGAGVLMYSSSGLIDFAQDSRVKAFCITPQASFYFYRATGCCSTVPPATCTPPYLYSKLQGLVYTQTIPTTRSPTYKPARLGVIYGNALIETIPSNAGQTCSYPSCNCWQPDGIGASDIYDTFPTASGRGATISELPLRIRGLYNLLVTTPE